MSSKQHNPSKWGLLKFLLLGLIGLGLSYVCIIGVITIPTVQTYITYSHHLDVFGYTKFDRPEDYGLAPGKTINMKLPSLDSTSLGAWFIFADSIYRKTWPHIPSPSDCRECKIPSALGTRPTILFLHGNTGTRAFHSRVRVYSGLSARLDANIFAIDYRGFGDSEGHPTVEGVSQDARAAWNYLVAQGAKPEDVLVVGHSLGTAIASLLVAELVKEGVEPRGLVLMSPFSSLHKLMFEYNLLGLPLLKPIAALPVVPRLLVWSLKHKFDTLSLVPEVDLVSILIAHGEDDWEISHTHSSVLFDAFLEPYLPSGPTLSNSSGTLQYSARKDDERAEIRKAIVKSTFIREFGTLEEFIDHQKGGRRVAMLKTNVGGHGVGRLEGVQDVMGRMFSFH